MPVEKSKFYWARIGDGNYEPVAVTGKKGSRQAFTIGCPDPIDVDGPESPIELHRDGPCDVPLTPKQEENARRREARWRKQNAGHGYAGFGRHKPKEPKP